MPAAPHQPGGSPFAAVAGWILRHRGLTALGLVGLVAGALAGGVRVRADFTTQELFARNDPDSAYLDAFRRQFGADDNTIVLAVEAPDVLDPAALRVVDRLTRAAREIPLARRVHSLTTVSDLRSPEAGVLDTSPLLGPLLPDASPPPAPAARAELRERALASPLVAGTYVSRDARVGLVAVDLENRRLSATDIAPAVERLRALAGALDLPAGTRVHLAGIPVVRHDAVAQIVADQFRFMPLAVSLTVLLLLAYYRSAAGVLIPVGAVGISVLGTVGVMGALDLPLDILNNVLPMLIMVYGVADAVHMLARIREEGGRETDRRAAVRRAMGHLGLACLITSGTTAVGFASLALAEMRILRRLGLLAAVGVLLAYLVSLVVVPLAATLGRGVRHAAADARRGVVPRAVDRLLGSIARLAPRRPRLVFGLGVALAAGALLLGSRVEVDNYLLGVYSEQHPTTVATRLLERHLEGVVNMHVSLTGGAGALKDPALLRAMLELQSWAESQPEVTGSASAAEVVREMYRTVAGRPGIPDTREGVAQLLLMAEGDTGLDRLVSYDDSRGRISLTLTDIGAQRYLALTERVKRAADRYLGAQNIQIRLTGSSLLAYRGINHLVIDLLTSLSVALVVIAVVLAVVFRSVGAGLLSMIPNGIPLAAGLGFMGLTGMKLEPATMMVFSIALGIAVDDTIHFFVRYREEVRGGASAARAVDTALHTAGRAMVITSMLLVAGFLVTQTSGFPATVAFGRVGTVVLLTALATDLLVTPAALLVFRPWVRRDAPGG